MAKTLRSRIAAVAVAALGLGLLQAAPANAVTTVTASSASPATVTAGQANVVVTITAVANDVVGMSLVSGPVTNVPGQGTTSINSVGANANVAVAPNAAASVGAAATTGTITLAAANLTVSGTYVFCTDAGAAAAALDYADCTGVNSVTITVLPAFTPPTSGGTLTSYTGQTTGGTEVYRADVAGLGGNFVRLGVTRATAGAAIKVHILRSADSDMPAGTTLTGDKASLIDFTSATSADATLDFTNNAGAADAMDTAGTYQFMFWADSNGNDAYDSGEAYGNASILIGGAPYAISSSLSNSAIQPLGTSNVTYSVTDSAGRATILKAGQDSIAITAVTNLSYTSSPVVAGARVAGTNTYKAIITAAAATAAGAKSIVGTLTVATVATTTTATSSLTVFTSTTGTSLAYVANAGILPDVAGDVELTTANAAAAVGGITVDLAKTTVYFTAKSATAGDILQVTVTPFANTNAGIISPAGLSYQTTLGDTYVTFPVTATGATAGKGYTITVEAGATDLVYTVTYADPGAVWTVAPGAAIGQKTGTDTVITGTLKDVFGRVLASKAVSATVAGRNPAQAFTGTTDANGVWSFTIKDTSTATLTAQPSDTVTLTYNYTNVAGTASTATGGSVAITYAATAVTAGSVVVTSANTTRTVDQTERVAGSPLATAQNVYTATVKDADGAPVADGTVVTFTGGADDVFLNGIKTGTTTSGVASVTVYRKKSGYANITASAGGKSGSNASTLWSNDAGGYTTDGNVTTNAAADNVSDARFVTVSADQTAIAGGAATVTATVTDRWGNPVSGVLVTWSSSGVGRGVTGADTTVGTDVNGKAQFQVTSLASETGTMTVIATIPAAGQAVELVDTVGGVTVAGVKAGNYTASSAVKFAAAPAAVADPSITALTTAVQSMMTAIQVMMTSLSSSITKLLAALAPAKKK